MRRYESLYGITPGKTKTELRIEKTKIEPIIMSRLMKLTTDNTAQGLLYHREKMTTENNTIFF